MDGFHRMISFLCLKTNLELFHTNVSENFKRWRTKTTAQGRTDAATYVCSISPPRKMGPDHQDLAYVKWPLSDRSLKNWLLPNLNISRDNGQKVLKKIGTATHKVHTFWGRTQAASDIWGCQVYSRSMRTWLPSCFGAKFECMVAPTYWRHHSVCLWSLVTSRSGWSRHAWFR